MRPIKCSKILKKPGAAEYFAILGRPFFERLCSTAFIQYSGALFGPGTPSKLCCFLGVPYPKSAPNAFPLLRAAEHFAILGRPNAQSAKNVYVFIHLCHQKRLLPNSQEFSSAHLVAPDLDPKKRTRPWEFLSQMESGGTFAKLTRAKRGRTGGSTGRWAKREARGPERRRVGGPEGPPAIRRGGL